MSSNPTISIGDEGDWVVLMVDDGPDGLTLYMGHDEVVKLCTELILKAGEVRSRQRRANEPTKENNDEI